MLLTNKRQYLGFKSIIMPLTLSLSLSLGLVSTAQASAVKASTTQAGIIHTNKVHTNKAEEKGEITQPNVIIFYVDDLGWQDTQLNDIDVATPWETPNMLELASQGMNFSQAYSAAPTCAPSRAGIISGQHPAKLQLTHVDGAKIPTDRKHDKTIAPFFNNHLTSQTLTIAKALQQNGYRTGQIGKWHLGKYQQQGPLANGFDYAFEDRGVHRKSKDRSKVFAGNGPKEKYRLSKEKYAPFSDKNPQGISYPLDLVTEKAIEFVDNSKDKPFFLYLAHWMVHYPIVTQNRALLEHYTDKLGIDFPQDKSVHTTPGQSNPYYGAMVSTVDWSLGRLMSYLKATDDPRHVGKKLIETTYIFLTSDNGGMERHGKEIITDNFPLDQGKQYAQEGGIRVPMVVSGPNVVQESSYQGLVNQLDYFPTILKLTNSSISADDQQKLSGLDISAVLAGQSDVIVDNAGQVRKSLFWHFPHGTDDRKQSAIRQGDFKLYLNHVDGSFELYRLYQDGKRADLEERFNLTEQAEFSPVVKELKDNLAVLLKDNNAEYPNLNPHYKGKLAGKNKVPVISSADFSAKNQTAVVNLTANRTTVASAYVLGKLSENWRANNRPRVTYTKIAASVSDNGAVVSAKIPTNIKEYLFVLIDENNFMVKSELYKTH